MLKGWLQGTFDMKVIRTKFSDTRLFTVNFVSPCVLQCHRLGMQYELYLNCTGRSLFWVTGCKYDYFCFMS
jgi:hypothetical protein